jgi:hypothetical protein
MKKGFRHPPLENQIGRKFSMEIKRVKVNDGISEIQTQYNDKRKMNRHRAFDYFNRGEINKSDLSAVEHAPDIFWILKAISGIIWARCLSSENVFHLSVQAVDPFHGFYIAYFTQVSFGG